jgi:hypothetical protein
MPKIWYIFEGKKHRYYPDVRLGNRLYEVKSSWTFGAENSRRRKIIKAKAKACQNLGYKFKCIVYSPKGEVAHVTSFAQVPLSP